MDSSTENKEKEFEIKKEGDAFMVEIQKPPVQPEPERFSEETLRSRDSALTEEISVLQRQIDAKNQEKEEIGKYLQAIDTEKNKQ